MMLPNKFENSIITPKDEKAIGSKVYIGMHRQLLDSICEIDSENHIITIHVYDKNGRIIINGDEPLIISFHVGKLIMIKNDEILLEWDENI